MSGGNINKVFYADSYHPIQAGSIDGTDILPHDNAVYRALLCSSAGLYDPFGDPKVIGDSYCTIFVGHLSCFTDEETLKKAMSRYGRVKNLRLVRHIVTGASRGYAFVEYETEREMRHAYELFLCPDVTDELCTIHTKKRDQWALCIEAHHTFIDDSEIIVDYSRQQLMPGWIPRRLGGGLGGKKESGQLRFGGRERPFRAPLRPIPFDDLKRLGITPPPEGRYLTRFEVPPPPRRRSATNGEDLPRRERKRTEDRVESPPGYRRKSVEREASMRSRRRSEENEGSPTKRRSSSSYRDSHFSHRRHQSERSHHHKRRSESRDWSP